MDSQGLEMRVLVPHPRAFSEVWGQIVGGDGVGDVAYSGLKTNPSPLR